MVLGSYIIFLLDIAGLRVKSQEPEVVASIIWTHISFMSALVLLGASGRSAIWEAIHSGTESSWLCWGMSPLTREKQTAASGFVLNAPPKCWWHPCWVQPQGKQWGTDWQPLRKCNWTAQIRHQGRDFIKQASDPVSSPARRKACLENLSCLWLSDNLLCSLIF